MTDFTHKPVVLPNLEWKPTTSHSSRNGAHVRLVVVHRWGAPYKDLPAEAKSYEGVQNWFMNPANQVSAHFVFPGSAVPGECCQMVTQADKAWAESFYNPISTDIETADAIWVGNDAVGMEVLARIVAFQLHKFNLPATYVHGQDILDGNGGFCRHADLGSAGGGHTSCPTTDLNQWGKFVQLVQYEAKRGGFRKVWDK